MRYRLIQVALVLDRGEARVLLALNLRHVDECRFLRDGRLSGKRVAGAWCRRSSTVAQASQQLHCDPGSHKSEPHLWCAENPPHHTSHSRTNSPPKSQYSRNFHLPPPPSHDDDLRQPISPTHPPKSPPPLLQWRRKLPSPASPSASTRVTYVSPRGGSLRRRPEVAISVASLCPLPLHPAATQDGYRGSATRGEARWRLLLPRRGHRR